jgi:hypothetical protein
MLAEDGGVNKKLNLRGALEKYKNPEKIKEEKKRGRLIALKNTIIVDANVILRYLLNDNQEQSKKANQTKPNQTFIQPKIWILLVLFCWHMQRIIIVRFLHLIKNSKKKSKI